MKFTVNRAELLAQVKNILKVVPATTTVAILKGILIEADADAFELTLTSTNYEAAIQCKLNAAVESGGSMVIDAKLADAKSEQITEYTIHIVRLP